MKLLNQLYKKKSQIWGLVSQSENCLQSGSLDSNLDYLENWCRNLFKTNVAEKDVCHIHRVFLLDCNFSLSTDFLTVHAIICNKRNEALSEQSKKFITFLFFALKY